jgi:hypothetical protein
MEYNGVMGYLEHKKKGHLIKGDLLGCIFRIKKRKIRFSYLPVFQQAPRC